MPSGEAIDNVEMEAKLTLQRWSPMIKIAQCTKTWSYELYWQLLEERRPLIKQSRKNIFVVKFLAQ